MKRKSTDNRPMMRPGLAVLSALLLTGCSLQTIEPYDLRETPPEAVSFGAYLNRGVETRAGAPGILKKDSHASGDVSLQTAGFGVFGYHTDASLYSQAALPNFMYNTKVSTSSWTYSPLKYWPNEFGIDAESVNIDRLTFFAYAPWVKVTSATGVLDATEYDGTTPEKFTTTGITRLTRATDAGDPKVSYKVSFVPANCVDLCWGVANVNFSSASGTSEGTNNIAIGAPYVDVCRPKVDATGKIQFKFEHALAALNVQVQADITGDQTFNPAKTKVYVRSVTFEGFTDEGSLNLNSSTTTGAQWLNYFAMGPVSTSPVTVHDGLRNGREAVAVDNTETPTGLNPVIIQSAKYSDSPKAGVTTTAVNLFDGAAATDPVYVIPNGDELKVTITYDVETRDDKILGTLLADGEKHGSVVENTITKTISGITLQAGTKYTVTLHLGLNSVDFEASVSAWSAESATEVGLPQNS